MSLVRPRTIRIGKNLTWRKKKTPTIPGGGRGNWLKTKLIDWLGVAVDVAMVNLRRAVKTRPANWLAVAVSVIVNAVVVSVSVSLVTSVIISLHFFCGEVSLITPPEISSSPPTCFQLTIVRGSQLPLKLRVKPRSFFRKFEGDYKAPTFQSADESQIEA